MPSFSGLAEGSLDKPAFQTLDLRYEDGETTTTKYFPSLVSLLPRLRGKFRRVGMQWPASNFAFVTDGLAAGSASRHLRLAINGGTKPPIGAADDWYEPLFCALRQCRKLESVEPAGRD